MKAVDKIVLPLFMFPVTGLAGRYIEPVTPRADCGNGEQMPAQLQP